MCNTREKKCPAAREATAQKPTAYRCILPALAELGGVSSHGSWLRGKSIVPDKPAAVYRMPKKEGRFCPALVQFTKKIDRFS